MAKTITLDPSPLGTGETVAIHNLTYTNAAGTEVTVKALLTADVTIPAGGGSGLPEGWEQETLNIVLDGKIVTRKIFVETASKADVSTWSTSDNRKLLQVNSSGVLRLDYGKAVD